MALRAVWGVWMRDVQTHFLAAPSSPRSQMGGDILGFRRVHVSIVSHGHGAWLPALLADLQRCAEETPLRVTLTYNRPEGSVLAGCGASPYPIEERWNDQPMGFGENHNRALRGSPDPYLCVLNPDVRLPENPFPELIQRLEGDVRIGVVAPAVVSPSGDREDSVRSFPRPRDIATKAARKLRGINGMARLPERVDWVAGMFMLFRASAFSSVGGFDEGYFLYYEDVDICARLQAKGWGVGYEPTVAIVHSAQHSSHRDLRYLRWHVASLLRFWRSPAYRAMK